jgi:hypothetical protein
MTILLVSELTTPSAADVALDRFTAELAAHLGRPIQLLEQPFATVDLAGCDALLLRARDLDAGLARTDTAGLTGRTIALDVLRSLARELVEGRALAGALSINAYRDWQYARPTTPTGRGLWGRLDLAPRLDAQVIAREQTAHYGLLERRATTLPALVAAYLAALLPNR